MRRAGHSGRWLALAWAAALGAGGAVAAGAWNIPLEAAFGEPVAVATAIPPAPPRPPAVAQEPPPEAEPAVIAVVAPVPAELPAEEPVPEAAPALPVQADQPAETATETSEPPADPATAEPAGDRDAAPAPMEPASLPDPAPPAASQSEAIEDDDTEPAEQTNSVQFAQATRGGTSDAPAGPATPRQRVGSAPLPPPEGAVAAPAGPTESTLPPPASLPSDAPLRAPRRAAADQAVPESSDPAAAPRAATAARVAPAPQRRGEVALVMRGLGRNAAATELAIQSLPPAASLAFAPGIEGLDRWIAQARARGHEIMLDLEEAAPPGAVQPIAAGPAGAIGLLEQSLARSEGLTGLVGGARSSADAGIRDTLRTVRGRGLLLVEPAGESRGAVARLGAEIGLPVASGLTLDGAVTRPGLDDRLREAEAAARRGVPALVIVAPRPLAYERLMAWSATLADRGITLVPVSAIAARRTVR